MGFTADDSTRMEDLINDWAYDEIKNEVDLEEVIEVINNTYQQLGISRTAETLGDIKVFKDELAMLNANLDRKADALENVSYTDSIQFIQNFIQSNSDSGLDMPKLIETVNAIKYSIIKYIQIIFHYYAIIYNRKEVKKKWKNSTKPLV